MVTKRTSIFLTIKYVLILAYEVHKITSFHKSEYRYDLSLYNTTVHTCVFHIFSFDISSRSAHHPAFQSPYYREALYPCVHIYILRWWFQDTLDMVLCGIQLHICADCLEVHNAKLHCKFSRKLVQDPHNFFLA